ncbi:MAG: FAD-dependent oxidoreductase [Candidatus Neoclostridium sp.]
MKKYDVIVVGGGFSGTMAACAAAREGLSVLLTEKSGTLGGAASLNYVLPFMNYRMKTEKGSVMLNRGLFSEFLDRMSEYARTDGGSDGSKVFAFNRTAYNEEFLKIVLDDMTDFYGVDVLFHAFIYGAECDGGRIKSVRASGPFGVTTLNADYFVDCTGDALLAALSGCDFHVGRAKDGKCQPMTLCFRMGNVDVKRFFEEDHAKINALWKQKLADKSLINPREDVLAFRTTTDSVLHLNSTRVLRSPVDAFEKSKAEKDGRKQMLELYRFLVANAPSCRNATLLSSSVEIGVRESRMIEGEYVFTEEDIISCRKFDDAIAAGNYDIDIHSPDGSGTSHYWIPDGEYYTVPYRSLVPLGKKNLLVAGRCISSTHEAQASYRIMPIVACIGEGAGAVLGTIAKEHKDVGEAQVSEIRAAIDKYDLIEGYPAALGEK